MIAGLGRGSWVAQRLGISLRTTSSPVGLPLTDLLGLALRRNPRRAQLLVSTVLGKHIPTDPRTVYGAGRLLGVLVAQRLAGDPPVAADAGALLGRAMRGDGTAARELLEFCDARQALPSPMPSVRVLGYAETATALGHCVAEQLQADYLHSTRRAVPGVASAGGFEEVHSHASSHLLLPEDPTFFEGSDVLVLVDDEFSTGTTALNTITVLQQLHPRSRYLIAALVDLRTVADRARMMAIAAELGTEIEVVALASGQLDGGDDLLARGQALVTAVDALAGPDLADTVGSPAQPSRARWPATVRDGGRHGFGPTEVTAARAAARAVATQLSPEIAGDRVLVLGFEELMYAPLLIATELTATADASGLVRSVHFSTTTRSPVLAVDDPGYAIRTRLAFTSHDDGTAGDRYAYNVAPGGNDEHFTDIVLVIDDVFDQPALHGPDGVLTALGRICPSVHLLILPSYRPVPTRSEPARLPEPLYGPAFGSYRSDEVAWLLSDLSAVDLEAPTEEREEAIQHGGAHYAESLPVEYQPSTEYQQLFVDALRASAHRLAVAVGVVTELVLAARGPDAVLVSLARAGTPVGILMRRWAEYAHGLRLPHFAVSIVRGRGIDQVALRYLAAHHRPANVMFVDGWTGKGAITRELADAVGAANSALGLAAAAGFAPDLAVLADTGGCTPLYGTRDDFLIPSACLNSTVSGLISRTVLNELIGADDFHGAKFYADLADADVSNDFLDVVTGQFAAAADTVAVQWPVLEATDRRPTWTGWDAVEKISAGYGIDNVNLVKPGVGETTRVLLRRVPWRVLMHPDAAAELGHIRHLAEQRGVEIEYVPDLAYSCVGLIHPRFTRGAVGADGSAVQ